MTELEPFFLAIADEVQRAEKHEKHFHSLHEAYAVIAEELDELWDITRKKKKNRCPLEIEKELVQVAAMALKALQSLHNFHGGNT